MSVISKYITWLPGICLHSLINLASHNKGISQNFISFYFGSTLVLILGGNRLVTEKGSSYWLMNVIVFISLLWLSWWRWYQTNKMWCWSDHIICLHLINMGLPSLGEAGQKKKFTSRSNILMAAVALGQTSKKTYFYHKRLSSIQTAQI